MKRLLFGILSLGVVAIVVIGATRAYFTDQAILGNDISTAKLDVELRGPYASGIVIPVDTTQNFMGGMAPGVEFGVYPISVYNKGWGLSTLPVKYSWTAEFTGGSMYLFNKINIRVREGNCDWDPLTAGSTLYPYGPLKDMPRLQSTSPLNPNITRCTWIWYMLPTDADNTYQGLNTQFNLVLDATQVDNPGWDE